MNLKMKKCLRQYIDIIIKCCPLVFKAYVDQRVGLFIYINNVTFFLSFGYEHPANTLKSARCILL